MRGLLTSIALSVLILPLLLTAHAEPTFAPPPTDVIGKVSIWKVGTDRVRYCSDLDLNPEEIDICTTLQTGIGLVRSQTSDGTDPISPTQCVPLCPVVSSTTTCAEYEPHAEAGGHCMGSYWKSDNGGGGGMVACDSSDAARKATCFTDIGATVNFRYLFVGPGKTTTGVLHSRPYYGGGTDNLYIHRSFNNGEENRYHLCHGQGGTNGASRGISGDATNDGRCVASLKGYFLAGGKY